MWYRNFIVILFAFIPVLTSQSCTIQIKKAGVTSQEYDLKHPEILTLNDALLEISGISFYPKDTSIFAITDESGYLYKIHLTKNFITEKWQFDKKRDFEDVCYRNGMFYILESNGDIHTLKFSPDGDTVFTQTTKFATGDKGKNEFESLYYDSLRNSFILLCKECENDHNQSISAWSYQAAMKTMTPSVFSLNTGLIAKKTGAAKIDFKPSAATINPLTGDIWILSSVNKLLAVTDHNGNCKEVYPLDPEIFTQPEGITFTPNGSLIISNEAGNKYTSATIFIFKRKKII